MESSLLALLFTLVAGALGKSLDPHIIGGVNADVGEWPWQASLQYNGGGHTCGCSVLSDIWVITAAHCVGSGANALNVVVGLHQRSNWNYGDPRRHYISSIIKHQYFDTGPQFLIHDIALIRVQGNIDLSNNFVKTVPMAPTGTDFDNQWCYITGWGVTTSGGGSMSDVLKEAQVAVIPYETCSGYWYLYDGQICVGVQYQKGSCNGDSGGPLVCQIDGVYHLAGLTSYGIIDCYTSHPSVYTRMSWYRGWVNHHTGL